MDRTGMEVELRQASVRVAALEHELTAARSTFSAFVVNGAPKDQIQHAHDMVLAKTEMLLDAINLQQVYLRKLLLTP